MKIVEFTLHEALNNMPETKELSYDLLTSVKYDFFLLALGFETRSKSLSEQLGRRNFKCDEVIIFNYSTNIHDNQKNRAPIENALKREHRKFFVLESDSKEFPALLRKSINDKLENTSEVRILFDISVCSSKLLLTVLKVLFESNINLTVVYTEASVYYPIYEEYIQDRDKFKDRHTLGLTQGVENVILSQDYVGDNLDNSPEFVISFPTFKPDRTKSILIEIDEGIFSELKDRLVWIIGKPNMDEPNRTNRIKMLRELNEIEEGSDAPKSYEISTLHYKETIEILDRIYKDKVESYHINISDLGSKMQSVGIAIFCLIRPDVSVYFSIPEKYNPSRYSEGVKNHWMIEFGSTSDFNQLLASIDSHLIVQ